MDDDVYMVHFEWPNMPSTGTGFNLGIHRQPDGNFPPFLIEPLDAEGRVIPGTWHFLSVGENPKGVTYFRDA